MIKKIACRYLFSRKQRSVINIISWISLVGLAVSTAALIVVLSVYNGIGDLTQSLFDVFDPEVMITPAEGKSFRLDEVCFADLSRLEGVRQAVPIVEENAWVTYRNHEAIVTLRGVGEGYAAQTGLDTLLYEGVYSLDNAAILGAEIWDRLGVSLLGNIPMGIHIPKRTSALGTTMEEAFNNGYLYPGANFYIQQDIDNKYVVADIDFVRALLDYAPDECSAVALSTDGSVSLKRLRSAIAALPVGTEIVVRDRFEQQPLYYKVFRSERLAIILILALIVLISTLNLVASLSLLILDKRQDIVLLKSMGMTTHDVRKTFFTEGLMICATGVVAGLLLGFVVCFLQQQFGIIQMGNGGFLVSAFPVAMRLADFLLTTVVVMLISAGAVTFTVRRAKWEQPG